MRYGPRTRKVVTGLALLSVGVPGTIIGLGNPASGATLMGVPTPQEVCANGPVTIKLLKATNNPPFPQVVSAFEKKYSCVKVDVSTVPWGNLIDTVEVDASTPNAPDVFESDGPDVTEWAAKGVIMSLTPYVTWTNQIVPATIREESYRGQLYSPGLEQSSVALFYNATMLDKLGIHPPKTLNSAWTWQQALKAMQACQVGPPGHAKVWGLAASAFGNGTPGYSYRDLVMARSEGSPSAPPGSSAWKTFWAESPQENSVDGYIDTPQAVAGDTFYQNLYNKWGVEPKAGSPDQFIDGQACFDMQTSFDISNIDAAHVKFQWGVTPLPYFKTPITQTGSETIVVSKSTKHVAASVAFADYVLGPVGDLMDVKIDDGMPVIKNLYSEIPAWNKYPLNIFYQELVHWGYPRPPSCHFLQYDQIMTSTLRNIAYGGSVSSNLSSAQSQLQPIMQSSCS